MFGKLPFARVAGAVFALATATGFAAYVLLGATTDKGTTGAIAAEAAVIMRAEKASCARYGSYASISTLRKERLLTIMPVYNYVVYVPGGHCGTVTVGSPAYQAPAG
jgi:hypothetical protein